MKLIYIYGPPAVGKLTVAQALAQITGYPLFHNHQTVDIAIHFFERGSDPFHKMINRLRLATLEEAQRGGIAGVVFTKMFDPHKAQDAVQFVQAVEALGVDVLFVRLYCAAHLLEQRVTEESRRQFDKLWEVDELRQKLEEVGEPFARFPGRAGLEIDTGKLAPDEAAQQIVAYYQLPVRSIPNMPPLNGSL